MTVVVSFVDYRPPVRFDGIPWTQVTVQEATAEFAEYVDLETIALSPLDADPSAPAYRNFTTELGAAPGLWYRVVFVDATGDTSQPSAPVQNTPSIGDYPTVRAYASVDELARILRLRAPTPAQQAAMQRVLDAAALEIDRELGLAAPYELAPALAVEVNLERAVEHWQQQESPFGFVGLNEGVPTATSPRSWERHAEKLVPLKRSWGIA